MSGINTGKVITGGVVAGLVYFVIDFITNSFIIAADMAANAARLGLDPAAMESGSTLATVVIVDVLFGMLVVFLYAGIRPRFGPGPKTATIAGVIPYLAVTLVVIIFITLGVFTWALFVKTSIIRMISAILGAVAGASRPPRPLRLA